MYVRGTFVSCHEREALEDLLHTRLIPQIDCPAVFVLAHTVRKMNSTLRQIELIPKTQTNITRKFKRVNLSYIKCVRVRTT